MDLGKKDNFKPFSPLCCAFFASHSSRINCQQTRTFIAKCTREGKQTKETRIVLGRINFQVFSCSLIVQRQIIWMISFPRFPDGFRGDYVEWDLTSASQQSRKVQCANDVRRWFLRSMQFTAERWDLSRLIGEADETNKARMVGKVGANSFAEDGACFRSSLVSCQWCLLGKVGRHLSGE